MILTLLKYLRHYIELIKITTSPNIITVRLKKHKVICEQCRIKMHFHGSARQRKVLIGESSWIVYRPLRYICPRCRRTKTINIPSVKPKARITEECKEQIIKALKYRVSINEVAKRYGISHTTVTRILRSYNATIDWEKFEGDLRLGIDEHSFRGYDMVTSVRELTTHTQLGFIYPDRKETLKEFLRNLPIKDKIKEVSVDMKSSYINSVREELPHAKIVLDHSHVVQDANREMLRAIEVESFVSKVRLPRKIFYKGIEHLKDKEKEKLKKVLKEHPYLVPYYVIKELIRKVYKARDRREAKMLLDVGINYGRKIGDPDLNRWVDKLTKYEEYILNYFESRTTNAQLEGNNLLVKLLKRISFGFRNPLNYTQRLSIAFSSI
jgi:transposase